MTFVPIDQIRSYHAHIYFKDSDERETAAVLRERIGERFLVQLGRWHEQPIGPHERPMYQVAFATALFASFVPWLMLNRCGLVILIHPNTGHARADHLVHALWLGNILAIERPEQLPEGPTDPAEDIVSPNTSPTLKPDC